MLAPTVAMESTVAWHLSVHFSMKSISENTSNCMLVPSDSALLCSQEPLWNYPPFLKSGFELIFNFSFEMGSSCLGLITLEIFLPGTFITFPVIFGQPWFLKKILCTFYAPREGNEDDLRSQNNCWLSGSRLAIRITHKKRNVGSLLHSSKKEKNNYLHTTGNFSKEIFIYVLWKLQCIRGTEGTLTFTILKEGESKMTSAQSSRKFFCISKIWFIRQKFESLQDVKLDVNFKFKLHIS